MSASGSNIFFFTSTALVPQDTDELGDLYDARIGGGVPSAHTNGCAGEGCQGALEPEPSFGTPGSELFQGTGANPVVEVASFTASKPTAASPKKKKKPSHAKHKHKAKKKRKRHGK